MTDERARELVAAQSSRRALRDLWTPLLQELWRASRREVSRQLVEIGDSCERDYRAGRRVPTEQRELLERLESLCVDRGLDMDEVLVEARDSEGVQSLLQKNPTRQNPYEPLATAFLDLRTPRTIRAVRLTDLALRFTPQGKIRINAQAEAGHSKSADIAVFCRRGQRVKAYLLAHKYARLAGGHQDNQWREACRFLEFALAARARDGDLPELRQRAGEVFGQAFSTRQFAWQPGMLLDGEYFEDAPSRLPSSQRRLGSGTAFVGSSDELLAVLTA